MYAFGPSHRKGFPLSRKQLQLLQSPLLPSAQHALGAAPGTPTDETNRIHEHASQGTHTYKAQLLWQLLGPHVH